MEGISVLSVGNLNTVFKKEPFKLRCSSYTCSLCYARWLVKGVSLVGVLPSAFPIFLPGGFHHNCII